MMAVITAREAAIPSTAARLEGILKLVAVLGEPPPGLPPPPPGGIRPEAPEPLSALEPSEAGLALLALEPSGAGPPLLPLPLEPSA